jgi:hypothetical protein
LNKENDYYRKIWDIDFTFKENLFKMKLPRNIEKEKQIESDRSNQTLPKHYVKNSLLDSSHLKIKKEEE